MLIPTTLSKVRRRNTLLGLVTLLGASACASIPTLSFDPDDGSVPDAPDGGGADSRDIPFDAEAAVDAAADPAPDAADIAADANTADVAPDVVPTCPLPAGSGPDAGCCALTIAPCVGLACSHCVDCAFKACHANQYCCAHVDGSGYKGVTCTPDTKACP